MTQLVTLTDVRSEPGAHGFVQATPQRAFVDPDGVSHGGKVTFTYTANGTVQLPTSAQLVRADAAGNLVAYDIRRALGTGTTDWEGVVLPDAASVALEDLVQVPGGAPIVTVPMVTSVDDVGPDVLGNVPLGALTAGVVGQPNGVLGLGTGGKAVVAQLGAGVHDSTKYLNGTGDWTTFPAVGGSLIDVTKSPYLADRTGATDCKAAFDQALADSLTASGGVAAAVYAPAGSYLFDAPLAPLGWTGSGTYPVAIIGDGKQHTRLLISSTYDTNHPYEYLITIRGAGLANTYVYGGAQVTYSTPSATVYTEGCTTGFPNPNSGSGVRIASGALVGTGTLTCTIQISDDPDFASSTTAGTITFDLATESSTTKNFGSAATWTKRYARVQLATPAGLTSAPLTISFIPGTYQAVTGVVLRGFSINANGLGWSGDYDGTGGGATFGRYRSQGILLDRAKWLNVQDLWLNKQRGYGLRCLEVWDSYIGDVKALKCGRSGGAAFPITGDATATSIEVVAKNRDPWASQSLQVALINGASSGYRVQVTNAGSVVETSTDCTTSADAALWAANTSAYVQIFDKSQGAPVFPAAIQNIAAPNAAVGFEPFNEFHSAANSNQITVAQLHLEDSKSIQVYLGRRTRRLRFLGLKCHGDLSSASIMTLFPHIHMSSAFTNQFVAWSMNRAGASHVEMIQHPREAADPSLTGGAAQGSDRNQFVACYHDSARTNVSGTGTAQGGLAGNTPSIRVVKGRSNRWIGCTWSSNARAIRVETDAYNTDNQFDAACDFHDIFSFTQAQTGDITAELTGPIYGRWRDPATGNRYYYDAGTLRSEAAPSITPAFSVSGVLTVATGKSRFYVEEAMTILSARVNVGTAPTGAAIICDVNKNGTTIFTTQANRPTIAISGFTSGAVTNMDVVTLAAGDYLTVDVDQVGSTVAGSDLVAEIRLQRV